MVFVEGEPLRVSIVVTTYNWEGALDACLASLLCQKRLPDQIVIADDGSREETRALIDQYKAISPIPIVHVWHEDLGFRAAKIRNMAIARTEFEYLISVDGDMVLHPEFVKDHIRAATPGAFCQGKRVVAGPAFSQKIMAEKQYRVGFWSPDIRNRKNTLHLPWISRLFSPYISHLKGIRTCNFGFWREDAILVNGFNERFEGWGREDSDFALRLKMLGLVRKNINFAANALHLFHGKRPLNVENDELLSTTQKEQKIICDVGLDQYLQE